MFPSRSLLEFLRLDSRRQGWTIRTMLRRFARVLNRMSSLAVIAFLPFFIAYNSLTAQSVIHAKPAAVSAAPPAVHLANISTRLAVGTGNNVLIAGFIVTGTQPKKIIVRGIGPTLPVNANLADP